MMPSKIAVTPLQKVLLRCTVALAHGTRLPFHQRYAGTLLSNSGEKVWCCSAGAMVFLLIQITCVLYYGIAGGEEVRRVGYYVLRQKHHGHESRPVGGFRILCALYIAVRPGSTPSSSAGH